MSAAPNPAFRKFEGKCLREATIAVIMQSHMRPITLLLLTLVSPLALAQVSLTLHVPEGMKVKSAAASSWETKLATSGKIEPASRAILFEKLLPDTPYELALSLEDGTVLQGVNLDWYGMEPAKPNAAAISEEDTKAITEMVTETKTFENKKRILNLRGDGDRITALVELIRDTDFHDSGGNIIWRVELWYYKNQFGGWQKVQQQSKVLARERFKDQKAFNAKVAKIKWIPELGGLKIPKGKDRAEVTLKPIE